MTFTATGGEIDVAGRNERTGILFSFSKFMSTEFVDEASPPSPLREALHQKGSTWRCILACAFAAVGISLLDWPLVPGIHEGGWQTPLLLGLSLILCGPPRWAGDPKNRIAMMGRGLFWLALGWPVVAALGGLVLEKEAAMLSLPLWLIPPTLLALSWRLRDQDPGLPLLLAVAAGLLAVRYATPDERVWLIAMIAWIVGVHLMTGPLRPRFEDSPPVIGAAAWFVLFVASLAIQEWRALPPPIVASDLNAATAALRDFWPMGCGFGGFERIVQEYYERDPAHGPFQSPALIRMATELGVPCILLLLVSLALCLFAGIGSRGWSRTRVAAFGAAGLWIVAAIAARASTIVPLAWVMLLVPSSLGKPQTLERPASEDLAPPYAWPTYIISLVAILIAAIVPTAAALHWRSQDPTRNLGATPILPYWTRPMRDHAWLIRDRSAEMIKYTDPREKLRPIVKQWLEAAPHDEFAWIEAVRLAHKTGGPVEGRRVGIAGLYRLPWNDHLVLWVIRCYREEGDAPGALQFLGEIHRRRGVLNPVLARRMAELQGS